jgi:hypothetical protein
VAALDFEFGVQFKAAMGEKADCALKRGLLLVFVGQRLSWVSLVGGVRISYPLFSQFMDVFLLFYLDLSISRIFLLYKMPKCCH